MPETDRRVQPTGSFTVGDWLVVPSLNRLSRGEETVQLELKMMEVLVHLAGRAGELVSKRELVDSVWQVEVISDGTLTRAVALLRKALGDDARNPRYIETIPKRGYRFIAPVDVSNLTRSPTRTVASRFLLEAPNSDIPLAGGKNLIGRDPEATIRIDVPGVSRRHAMIVIDGADVTIEDLGSKNGTYLRDRRILKPRRLAHGDEIRIGHKVARFRFVIDD
jgi:DNA-binding winged helix-turn-helix (wHTH) protein